MVLWKSIIRTPKMGRRLSRLMAPAAHDSKEVESEKSAIGEQATDADSSGDKKDVVDDVDNSPPVISGPIRKLPTEILHKVLDILLETCTPRELASMCRTHSSFHSYLNYRIYDHVDITYGDGNTFEGSRVKLDTKLLRVLADSPDVSRRVRSIKATGKHHPSELGMPEERRALFGELETMNKKDRNKCLQEIEKRLKVEDSIGEALAMVEDGQLESFCYSLFAGNHEEYHVTCSVIAAFLARQRNLRMLSLGFRLENGQIRSRPKGHGESRDLTYLEFKNDWRPFIKNNAIFRHLTELRFQNLLGDMDFAVARLLLRASPNLKTVCAGFGNVGRSMIKPWAGNGEAMGDLFDGDISTGGVDFGGFLHSLDRWCCGNLTSLWLSEFSFEHAHLSRATANALDIPNLRKLGLRRCEYTGNLLELLTGPLQIKTFLLEGCAFEDDILTRLEAFLQRIQPGLKSLVIGDSIGYRSMYDGQPGKGGLIEIALNNVTRFADSLEVLSLCVSSSRIADWGHLPEKGQNFVDVDTHLSPEAMKNAFSSLHKLRELGVSISRSGLDYPLDRNNPETSATADRSYLRIPSLESLVLFFERDEGDYDHPKNPKPAAARLAQAAAGVVVSPGDVNPPNLKRVIIGALNCRTRRGGVEGFARKLMYIPSFYPAMYYVNYTTKTEEQTDDAPHSDGDAPMVEGKATRVLPRWENYEGKFPEPRAPPAYKERRGLRRVKILPPKPPKRQKPDWAKDVDLSIPAPRNWGDVQDCNVLNILSGNM